MSSLVSLYSWINARALPMASRRILRISLCNSSRWILRSKVDPSVKTVFA
jgi:hypothetical protein